VQQRSPGGGGDHRGVSQKRAALPGKTGVYAEGWEDGFRQCKAMRENEELRDYKDNHWDDRERAWQQEKNRDAARAYRSQ